MSCTIRSLFAAFTMVGLAGAALAQPSPSLTELSVEQLKSLYLHCDRIGSSAPMDLGTAVLCVEAGDRLRERAFGGSSERLIAWWREQRAAGRHAREAAPSDAPAAQPPAGTGEQEQLKAAYLQCDRLAMTQVLDFGTAAQCSVIYETLKARVFGGDFQRLLAWSRQQQGVPLSARPAVAATTP